MLKHEAKLIDPDAEAIVAALTTAAAAANKRCRARLLADDPAKWRKFARAAAAAPEGYAMFRGGRGGVPATQVLAAWWTDAAGRKHVVLRGRRVEHDEAKRLLYPKELDARPPLWHAYPEYVCRRTAGKDSQVVCACGCGAVGTPESLGWMGETCGPCFDRKEEVGAGALSANLPGVLYGDRAPLGVVACSPDGSRVAAKEGDNFVSYWDITRRTRTTVKFSGHPVTDVAITPDARHLLVTGVGLVAGIGLWAAFDLSTDPPARVEPTLEFDPPAYRVLALPEPDRAVVLSLGDDARMRWDVVRVPGGETVRGSAVEGVSFLGAFARSFDGTRLTAGDSDGVRVYDLETGGTPGGLPDPFGLVAFSHDGTRLFAKNSGPLTLYDLATQKRLARGATDLSLNASTTTLAVDPAGEWVYAGSWEGKVYVFSANTLERRAVFEWHLGAVQGLAVSADGSRLFSSGGDGCVKVWPIRDLMKGI
jgi:hypothetical protein